MPYTDGYERSTRLALGRIRGVESVQVRGFRYNLPGFAEAYIWDGPTLQYTFSDPLTGQIDTVSSSSILDVAKDIRIIGLDNNWNNTVQTVALNGQNKVALSTFLIRINQIIALSDLIGDLYVYENTAITGGVPNDLSKVKGFIGAGNNISQTAIFTVPAGFIGVFKTAAYGLIPSAQCCTSFINAIRTYGFAELRLTRFPLVQGGTTLTLQTPKTSFAVPEKTDLYVLATTSTPDAAVSVVADWEIVQTPNSAGIGTF
jgi:hypothetical protein